MHRNRRGGGQQKKLINAVGGKGDKFGAHRGEFRGKQIAKNGKNSARVCSVFSAECVIATAGDWMFTGLSTCHSCYILSNAQSMLSITHARF